LRLSLRLCPQAEFPLQACALRLHSTLRPPSGLHSTPARTLRLAPSSPAAFQPALWSALSGVRLSPRALNFEPTLWQCHPAEPRLLARTLRSVSLVSAQPLGSSLRLAPSIQPLGIGPEACSATLCTCLAACASRSGQLPPAWTLGLSIPPACAFESALRLVLFHVRLAPPASVSPALWPCLGVPFRCLPACAWNQSPGLPFRTGSCEPVLPVPFRSLFHSRLAPFASARPSGLPSGSSSGLRPPPTLPAAFAVCRPACACLLTLRLRRGPVGYS